LIDVGTRYTDATTTANPFADNLLQHFNRWIATSSSLLFDPALHRMIRRLMAKVHGHLVSELRRFGATVVFADFSRIILATNKHTLEEATVRPRVPGGASGLSEGGGGCTWARNVGWCVVTPVEGRGSYRLLLLLCRTPSGCLGSAGET
jgi:hypothetical protein